MKKPLKILLIIVLVLVVAVLALIVSLPGLVNGPIREQVEVQASKALQTNVAVGGVKFSLFQGSGGIQNLAVDNLPGYEHARMMELGECHVDVGLKTLMDNPIRIQQVKLDNITVVLEQKKGLKITNNIKEMLDKLQKEDEEKEKDKEKAKAEKEADEKPAKDIVIDQLEIRGVVVKVKLLPVPGKIDTMTIKLDPIIMEGLGTGEHMDVGKLSRKVFLAIINGILKQGGELPGAVLEGLGEGLKGLGSLTVDLLEDTGKALQDTGKALGEGAKDVGKELEEGVKDVGKNLEDSVKGIGDLFKKDEKKDE